MDKQTLFKDIKPFEWEELDGKTLQIRAGKQEGVLIVVGYDQETKDIFVLHDEKDPDPIPLPTIKPGPGDKVRRCYHCNETSSDRDWDLATEKKCGYPITRINEAPGEGAFFICPKCGKKSDYELLEVSHD